MSVRSPRLSERGDRTDTLVTGDGSFRHSPTQGTRYEHETEVDPWRFDLNDGDIAFFDILAADYFSVLAKLCNELPGCFYTA